MARIIIADAGPLIAFASIDALSVLQKLFSAIHVVASVRQECLSKPGADTQRIKNAFDEGWLIQALSGQSPEPLSPGLGLGESDSMRFALDSQEASLLIMDDRLARRFALKQQLNIVGTVRLLDEAEQRGLIDSAEHHVDKMVSMGYRISLDLLDKIRMGK